jgi:geranylgeranyl diphosphate synthase type I
MRELFQANGSARPAPFYGMMQYHMGWVDASFEPEAVYAGKQIRPILTLLICEAAGGNWRQALPAAASIEILHNFSLVHDDIEDSSPTRRGRATVWKIWGEAQAINVGDAMYATAQLAMTRLFDAGVSAENVVTALRRLNETCIELTQGQCADMQFERREAVTTAEYMAMIRGKTAVLIGLACELGALIAGADAATVAHYARYGLDLGLAFQVIDDILGVWGDEGTIGKSAESDILTKKKTLPILYGLEHSRDLQNHFQQAATTPEFVANAVSYLDNAGARSFAEALASRYSEAAIGHLLAAQPRGEAASALNQLTALLLSRES